jgi:hypothetical protein
VILSRGDDLPAGLLPSLRDRGVEVVVTGRPIWSFVELVRLEQSRPRSQWGLPSRSDLALVIAARDRWESLDQLLAAVRRHFPEVPVWVGTEHLILEVSPPAAPSAAPPAAPPAAELPPLRLAGLGEGAVRSGNPVETTADRPPPSPPPAATEAPTPEHGEPARRTRSAMDAAVTPEEIDMLLRLFDEGSPSPTGDQPPSGGDS